MPMKEMKNFESFQILTRKLKPFLGALLFVFIILSALKLKNLKI